jgi:hypothetical protein
LPWRPWKRPAFTRSNLLLGNPNVGKSVLLEALTGAYVTVSHYPGTTVEVMRGLLRGSSRNRPVVDLPGIYSLVPDSDDERVALDALLEGAAAGATVVLVADTKNLERGLLLAFELTDAGIPFVVSLGMADEAEQRGIAIDTEMLACRGFEARRTSQPEPSTAGQARRTLRTLDHAPDLRMANFGGRAVAHVSARRNLRGRNCRRLTTMNRRMAATVPTTRNG